MKYMGSKNKYAKILLPIILKDRKEEQYYVEPFCGGCGLLKYVEGNRIASDNNFYLIETFKALQNGWIMPEEVTEELYRDIKNNLDDYPPHLAGYVGFQLSYGAKWFGGYRRDKIGKRNYSMEAYRNVEKDIPLIQGVDFFYLSYDELVIPDNSIIYCDPPYANTTKYKTGDFDHDKFWEWCRNMTKKGHTVYISEYTAPDDFKVVWEKEVNNTLDKNTGSKKGTEKLFVMK